MRFHVWAFLLVLGGMALAAGWALFLPIFLAPDEDSHYDYALTLYTAGRAMRPQENVVERDTHPVVEYLMRATHAREQRLDAGVGTDAGYGTAAYYRKLDAAAPRLMRAVDRSGRIVPVPYISRLYPIGYYALASLAIGLGDRVTHGSVVGMVFFVRYLSVALFGSTLWFAWLALRELGLGGRRALLVLASLALFPMNAAFSGSVQPDVLAAALVAPLLYCALRLRTHPTNPSVLAPSGFLCAGLIATKHHYFAAAFVPVVALLLVRLPFRERPLRAWTSLAFLVIPSLVALGVTDRMLRPAPGGTGVCHAGMTYTLAHQSRPLAVAKFLLVGFERAFDETFEASTEFDSFWTNYTAYRTSSLVLGNEGITLAVRRMLPVVSAVVALAFLLRLAQVRRRLLRVACRRSWRSAGKIATSNVLINSYLCFFIILFAFEAYTGGSVPIQGRYWFPFLAGLWLCALTVAPKVLPIRLGRRVETALSRLLVAFCCLGSAAAFPSLHARFYAPLPRPPAAREILADVTVRATDAGSLVDGVAIDLRSASGVRDVVVRLDGTRSVAVRRVDRPRVACNMEKTLLRTGFEGALDTSELATGEHDLAIFVRTRWSPVLIDSGVRTRFEVGRRARRGTGPA